MSDRIEAIREATRLSSKIDEGVRELAVQSKQVAEAEREYRKGKALAWVQHREGTAGERAATVDGVTADLRFARDLADANRVTALEALRSRRAQLSMLQSILAADRAELEHAKFGPEVSP